MTIPFTKFTPAFLLALQTILFSILAATALDTLILRPTEGGGSITTLLPGFTYACATVMKVCLLATPIVLLAGLRSTPAQWPTWSLVALSIPPISPLLSSLLIITIQHLSSAAIARSGDFPPLARTGVMAMLGLLATGAAAATYAIYRRERPRSLAFLALFIDLALIALICYFRFYALEFHQDNWAPR